MDNDRNAERTLIEQLERYSIAVTNVHSHLDKLAQQSLQFLQNPEHVSLVMETHRRMQHDYMHRFSTYRAKLEVHRERERKVGSMLPANRTPVESSFLKSLSRYQRMMDAAKRMEEFLISHRANKHSVEDLSANHLLAHRIHLFYTSLEDKFAALKRSDLNILEAVDPSAKAQRVKEGKTNANDHVSDSLPKSTVQHSTNRGDDSLLSPAAASAPLLSYSVRPRDADRISPSSSVPAESSHVRTVLDDADRSSYYASLPPRVSATSSYMEKMRVISLLDESPVPLIGPRIEPYDEANKERDTTREKISALELENAELHKLVYVLRDQVNELRNIVSSQGRGGHAAVRVSASCQTDKIALGSAAPFYSDVTHQPLLPDYGRHTPVRQRSQDEDAGELTPQDAPTQTRPRRATHSAPPSQQETVRPHPNLATSTPLNASRSGSSETPAVRRSSSEQQLSSQSKGPSTAQTSSAPPDENIDRLAPNYLKLRPIYAELISTERTYVFILTTLVQKFIEPLRSSPSIASPDAVNSIFGDIELILKINSEFLTELDDPDRNLPIVKIFLRRMPSFKLYTSYILSYMAHMDALSKLRKKNARLQKFIVDTQRNPDCRGNTLEAMLITPIQRIPRYELLLKELVKHSDEGYVFYKDLVRASEYIHQVATYCNERKRDADSQIRLIELQEELKVKDLVQPHRKLLREGEATDTATQSVCKLYLLTDLLLRVDGRSRSMYPLLDCELSAVPPRHRVADSANYVCRGFRIAVPNRETDYDASFTFADPALAVEWLDAVAGAISGNRKRLSFTAASTSDGEADQPE